MTQRRYECEECGMRFWKVAHYGVHCLSHKRKRDFERQKIESKEEVLEEIAQKLLNIVRKEDSSRSILAGTRFTHSDRANYHPNPPNYTAISRPIPPRTPPPFRKIYRARSVPLPLPPKTPPPSYLLQKKRK